MNEENMHTNFSDAELERLLKQIVLEQDDLSNEQTLETMSEYVFATTAPIAIAPQQEQTLIDRLSRNWQAPFYKTKRFLLLAATMLLGIAAILFFSNTSNKTATTTKILPAPTPTPQNALPVAASNDSTNETTLEQPVLVASEAFPQIQPATDSLHPIFKNQVLESSGSHGLGPDVGMPEWPDDADVDIPVFSEKEKLKWRKNKQRMLRDIAKRKTYVDVPAGFTFLDSVQYPMTPFTIQTAEVCNLEYHTFLNDLVIQGRYDDYLLARPVANGWKAAGIEAFDRYYFSTSGFDTYPAVNMSRAGAELYCRWLTSSMREAIAKKEVKWSDTRQPEFRLPTELEWVYAARGSSKHLVTPWGDKINDVQNLRGCCLCNFNYDLSKDRLKVDGVECKASKGTPKYPIVTTAGHMIDSLVVAPTFVYNPNWFGLYCVLGNVAEMAWSSHPIAPTGPREAVSMGGSWLDPMENMRIETPEKHNGVITGKAFIGFRPILILN